MFNDLLNVSDYNTEITVTGPDGKVKQLWNENKLGRALRNVGCESKIPGVTGYYDSVLRNHNLITNVGQASAAGRLGNLSGYSNPFTYVALGTSTTAAAVTDTALGTEITTNGGARAVATASAVTTTVTNDTLQLVATWTFTGSLAITEEGILDSSSAGHLLAHQVFSAVNVNAGDSLTVTHKVTC